MITSFAARIHSSLLIAAAKHSVSLIICENFHPMSVMLPVNRSTDTHLTRAHLDMTARELATLWNRTVNAKVRNQFLLCQHLSPKHVKIRPMELVVSESHSHKEAIAARFHWDIFGDAIAHPDFVRDPDISGINSLLNYGYAVLLSLVLQKLLAVGLDPTFGIFHATREHATPLAYDLMEPFRPCVDWRVAQWVMREKKVENRFFVDREFRNWVTGFAIEPVSYLSSSMELRSAIEGVIRTFRRSVIEHKPSLYTPWTPKAIKWAGFS